MNPTNLFGGNTMKAWLKHLVRVMGASFYIRRKGCARQEKMNRLLRERERYKNELVSLSSFEGEIFGEPSGPVTKEWMCVLEKLASQAADVRKRAHFVEQKLRENREALNSLGISTL
jgi:hypothetical protein